jgi:ribonuclease VapC
VIVAASALLAIVLLEPERDRFLDILGGSEELSMSVINFVEAGIKVDRDPGSKRALLLDETMRTFAIDIAPVSAEQGRLARQAYRSFGRGSGHPARLNLGDCFAYALAKSRNEPLLFKGEEFIHTDVEAVAPANGSEP